MFAITAVSLIVLILLALKFKFFRDILAITIITIPVTILGYGIANTNFFNVYVYTESFAVKDFEFTDYAFAKLRPAPKLDERIVLVNIGTLSRRDLAKQIQIISGLKPRVIAFDGFFNCTDGLWDSVNCPALLDTLGNQLLSRAIQDAGNVILGTRLLQTDSLARVSVDLYDSIEISDPPFSNYALNGFVSLPTNATFQEDVKLCRTIFPQRKIKNDTVLSFSVLVAKQYDSVKAARFLARNNPEEIINFRGNIFIKKTSPSLSGAQQEDLLNEAYTNSMFSVLDTDEVLRGAVPQKLIRDNIVIMGYLGDYLGDPATEDKFFTPLNSKVAGRANPDMFGPVIHANAVAMILNEDYIEELTVVSEFIVGFFACLAHVALLLAILKYLHVWYDLAASGLIILQLALFGWMRFQLFSLYNVKAQLVVGFATLVFASIVVVVYKELFPHIRSRFRKSFVKDPNLAPTQDANP